MCLSVVDFTARTSCLTIVEDSVDGMMCGVLMIADFSCVRVLKRIVKNYGMFLYKQGMYSVRFLTQRVGRVMSLKVFIYSKERF